MMISPNCPEHGRLALDLAMGRLGDEAASRADEVVGACSVCREWWESQLESEVAAIVDDAVGVALVDLRLPSRRRGHGWVAAAAAILVTVGAASLWLAREPVVPQHSVPDRVAVIQRLDFEHVDLEAVASVSSSQLEADPVADEPVFVPQAVRAEEIQVTESTPRMAATSGDEGRLYAGGFESGGIAGWSVPST